MKGEQDEAKIYLGLTIALLIGIGLFIYISQGEAIFPVERIDEAAGNTKRELVIPEGDQVIGPRITNFEECIEATNLVLTTYPAKCVAPGGKVFVNSDNVSIEIIEEVPLEEQNKTK